MLTKYKGWKIENIANSYYMTRIEPVNGKKIRKRAKTQAAAKALINSEEARIAIEEEARIKAERERVITKRYEVQLKDHKPVIFELQRGPSGSAPYGNQTSVTFHEGERFVGVIDTRYDHDVMKDFGAWCVAYLKGYIDPKYEPQIAEI